MEHYTNSEPEWIIKTIALAVIKSLDDYYLFGLKKGKDRVNPDKLHLIGGHIEDQETPSAAVIREMEEEVNLVYDPGIMTIEEISILGGLTEFVEKTNDTTGEKSLTLRIFTACLVCLNLPKDNVCLESLEFKEMVWIAEDQVLGQNLTPVALSIFQQKLDELKAQKVYN